MRRTSSGDVDTTVLEYRHWRRGVGDMGSGVAMGPRGDASTLRAVPRMAAGMGSSISCPKYLTPDITHTQTYSDYVSHRCGSPLDQSDKHLVGIVFSWEAME